MMPQCQLFAGCLACFSRMFMRKMYVTHPGGVPSLAYSGYTLVRDKIVEGDFKFLELNSNLKIVCNKICKVDFIGKYIAL